jgi:NADH-quinone oxidoreductase subunit H
MNELTIEILISLGKTLFFFGIVLTGAAYSTLAERRFASFFQNRIGPNRAGPLGLFQPIADGIKFIMKEEVIPGKVNRFFFVIAPSLFLFVSLLPWSAIPFGDKVIIAGRTIHLQILDLNAGVLYMLAISSMGVYGILIGGWASNNKFSLLGGVRATAQMISYEITLGISIAAIFLISESLSTREIVLQQIASPWQWNIFIQPVGFIIFFVSMLAETNRNPFDLAEAESELVVGYHTEYGAFKYAQFMLGEYINLITASGFITLLYFGGWSIPFLDLYKTGLPVNIIGIISMGVFLAKTAFFVFVFMWIRWTLPRFRYDQLMHLGWNILLPLSIVNLLVTAFMAVLL